jgi:hypothetical protein
VWNLVQWWRLANVWLLLWQVPLLRMLMIMLLPTEYHGIGFITVVTIGWFHAAAAVPYRRRRWWWRRWFVRL